jgi:hypothetical protein
MDRPAQPRLLPCRLHPLQHPLLGFRLDLNQWRQLRAAYITDRITLVVIAVRNMEPFAPPNVAKRSEIKIPALSNVGKRLNVCDDTIIVFLGIVYGPVFI